MILTYSVTKILRNCVTIIIESFFKVANWLAVNKLSLNVKKKTHFVIFRAKNKTLTNNIRINIGNQNIEQVNSTSLLGLNIDQDLSWEHHKKVSSKIAKLSEIMIRARHYLLLKILQIIHYAFVYPYRFSQG